MKKLTKKQFNKILDERFTKKDWKDLYLHQYGGAYPLENYYDDFYNDYEFEFDEGEKKSATESINKTMSFLSRVFTNKDGEWEEY